MTIVHITLGDYKTDNLSPVINDNMNLESEEPAQRTLSLCGSTIKHPVLMLPFDMAELSTW